MSIFTEEYLKNMEESECTLGARMFGLLESNRPKEKNVIDLKKLLSIYTKSECTLGARMFGMLESNRPKEKNVIDLNNRYYYVPPENYELKKLLSEMKNRHKVDDLLD